MKISILQAKELLGRGEVVAIPTETVYGLAGSLYSEIAIQKIFALKNRPSDNPLIVHVASINDMRKFVDHFPVNLEELAAAFWPGPLTLILPASNIPKIASANLPTAAFRIPSHPLARDLLSITGPLVIPSANLSGRPSATCYQHVERDFGSDFPVIDGGCCENGLESTILIFKEERWQIARLGALAAEDFLSVLPYMPSYSKPDTSPICPGQMYRHYAPSAKLFLNNNFEEASLIIGFSDRIYPSSAEVWHLGSSQDPYASARTLYALLRNLDIYEKKEAWIDTQFPESGLWATLQERLKKAAS